VRLGTRRAGRRLAPPSEHAKSANEEIAGLGQVSEQTIYPHVFPNSDREVGGVLIGRTAADGTLPLITGAIPAISANEQRATLTFTQDAWEHVHRTLDSQFPPDEQIVGWYHSHPGFGIFLSGHDLFIHHNFFSGPSQIAVVVDPLARVEGAFVWQEQKVVELFERATPDQWTAEGPPQPPPTARQRAPEHSPYSPRERHPLLPLAIAAITGIGLGFGGWTLVAGTDGSSPDTTHKLTTRPHTATSPRTAQETETARDASQPTSTSAAAVNRSR
jgi:proteasome lid subunit RPN8/RPN11